MPLGCRLFGLLVLFLAIGAQVRGATYIVDSDKDIVRRAEGIVAGTVLGSACERAPSGLIRTITTIAVEEDFRDNATSAGAVIRVATWGGRLGNERMFQSGAPAFHPGERVLLLLTRDASGDWSTLDLALGKFTFAEEGAIPILARDASIEGWREDGRVHVERVRPREAFLQFVRDVVAGRENEWSDSGGAGVSPATDERLARRFPRSSDEPTAGRGRPAVAGGTPAPPSTSHDGLKPVAPLAAGTYSPTGYTIRYHGDTEDAGVRRFGSRLTVAWRLWTASGVPTGIDPQASVAAAAAAWKAATSGVTDLSLSATPASGSGTAESNTESRVVINDPEGVVSGSCCPGVIATTFLYCSGGECDYVAADGKQYLPITHADIVTNDGVQSSVVSQGNFDLAILHEMGHAVGLRHSDKRPDDVLPCSVPYHCCFRGSVCSAAMNAVLISGLQGLQTWDREAVACLYNGQCRVDPTCVAPVVTPEAANVSIPAFTRATIGVSASPMRPGMRFQWYRGGTGETASPVGNGAERYETEVLTRTARYWVRVTSDCGSTDSEPITVTVLPAKIRAVRR